MIGELPIPPRAAAAAGAQVELLRAWLVDDQIECSLAAGEENDLPSAWGEILAGVAVAVAEQISETTQPTVDHCVLSTIREHLELGTSVHDAADPMRHLSDLERLVAEFNEETDRAAAVLGGAALDAYLKESLRDFLVADKSVDDYSANTVRLQVLLHEST